MDVELRNGFRLFSIEAIKSGSELLRCILFRYKCVKIPWKLSNCMLITEESLQQLDGLWLSTLLYAAIHCSILWIRLTIEWKFEGNTAAGVVVAALIKTAAIIISVIVTSGMGSVAKLREVISWEACVLICLHVQVQPLQVATGDSLKVNHANQSNKLSNQI